MARKLRAHPVLAILPPLTPAELEVAVERVRLYGQRTQIETVDGMVVAGWEEYEACVAAGVTPKTVNIKEPSGLVEYVIRRLPRNLTSLDRACIAVLAEEEWKKLGRERMREAGRLGGRLRGKGTRTMPEPFGHEDWFATAARIVGTTAGAVKRLATLRRAAPDVFDAVRERKLVVLREARDLAQALKAPRARAKALALKSRNPKAPFSQVVAQVMRAERPTIASPKAPSRGQRWVVHEGPLEREGRHVPDATIDLVHADIVYGDTEMAETVARLSKRVLVAGGLLAVIAGHEVFGVMTEIARHLQPLAVGAYLLQGNGNAKWAAPVTRFDALPVLFFSKGRTRWPLAHLAFTSAEKDKSWHGWQKNVAATQDIILSCVPAGARVLDPCCGGGTTGEAAVRAGCEFIGIDVDPKAISATRARLSQVEQELAVAKSGRAVLRRVV